MSIGSNEFRKQRGTSTSIAKLNFKAISTGRNPYGKCLQLPQLQQHQHLRHRRPLSLHRQLPPWIQHQPRHLCLQWIQLLPPPPLPQLPLIQPAWQVMNLYTSILSTGMLHNLKHCGQAQLKKKCWSSWRTSMDLFQTFVKKYKIHFLNTNYFVALFNHGDIHQGLVG
jgi:hypothetical protein